MYNIYIKKYFTIITIKFKYNIQMSNSVGRSQYENDSIYKLVNFGNYIYNITIFI